LHVAYGRHLQGAQSKPAALSSEHRPLADVHAVLPGSFSDTSSPAPLANLITILASAENFSRLCGTASAAQLRLGSASSNTYVQNAGAGPK